MAVDADPAASPSTRSSLAGERARMAGSRRGVLLEAAMMTAAAAFVVVMILRRSAGRPVTRTLWAEDASQFLNGAYADQSPQGWFRPYGGYLHVLPRMIATVAVEFPPQRLPWLMAVVSAVLGAGFLVLFARGLRRWLPEAWMRAALVVAIGATPMIASEAGANVANLHWFVGLGLLGLVLMVPPRWPHAIAAGALAAVAALTDGLSHPYAALAVALLAVRVWRLRRGRVADPVAARSDLLRTLPVTIATVAGVLAQSYVSLTTTRPRPPGLPPIGLREVVGRYHHTVLADSLTLNNATDLQLLGQALVVVAAAVVAVRLARRGGTTWGSLAVRAGVVVVMLAASFGIFALSVVVNRSMSPRYYFVPAALIVTVAFVAVAGRALVQRVMVAGLTVAMLVSAVAYGEVTWRDRVQGPDVKQLLVKAPEQCADGRARAVVLVAPYRWNGKQWRGHWPLAVPCERLVDR
ncbi:MAG: hypothetical protein U0Q15_10175 [Kineosporiaceae bacterium]